MRRPMRALARPKAGICAQAELVEVGVFRRGDSIPSNEATTEFRLGVADHVQKGGVGIGDEAGFIPEENADDSGLDDSAETGFALAEGVFSANTVVEFDLQFFEGEAEFIGAAGDMFFEFIVEADEFALGGRPRARLDARRWRRCLPAGLTGVLRT